MSEALDVTYKFLNTEKNQTYRHDSFQLRYIFSNGNIGTDYDWSLGYYTADFSCRVDIEFSAG